MKTPLNDNMVKPVILLNLLRFDRSDFLGSELSKSKKIAEKIISKNEGKSKLKYKSPNLLKSVLMYIISTITTNQKVKIPILFKI